MPTTDISTTPTSSIVSPSPNLSRNRSFTMTDYTTITQYSFSFAHHPTCPTFSNAMNNAYSEDFDPAVVATFFTDTARTQVVPNVVAVIRAAIIDTVMLSTTATRPVVAPIVNIMALFGHFGTPTPQKLPLRSTTTFTTALDAVIAATQTVVVIKINSASSSNRSRTSISNNDTGRSNTGSSDSDGTYRTGSRNPR